MRQLFPLSPTSSLDETIQFPLVHSKPLLGQDPFELYQRIASPLRSSFLLESGKGQPEIARYSFMASDPYLVLSATGNQYETRVRDTVTRELGNPLQAFFHLLGTSKLTRSPLLPPFIGGAVGFFSYDMVRSFGLVVGHQEASFEPEPGAYHKEGNHQHSHEH